MNFKGFKKIASDKKCTTLQHEDGHELKIAHGVLSKKMRAELDKLPAHKEPKKMAYGGLTDNTEPYKEPEEEQSWFEKPGIQSLKESMAREEAPQIPEDVAAKAMADPNSDLAKHYPGELKKASDYYASQKPAEAAAPAPDAAIPQAAPAAPTPAPVAAPSPSPAMATPAAPPPAMPQGQGLAPSPRAPAEVAPPMAAPAAPQDPVAQELNAQAAPKEDNYQKSYQDFKQEHQQQWAQEDAAFDHDLANGHITPMTYHDLFAKKDTLGKIGTIFGLLLSGAGSGMSGQSSALMEMMNKEIKNDLDAQVQSKGNAQNLIKINQQQQLQNATIENMKKSGTLTDAQVKSMQQQTALSSYTLAQMQANRIALHNQAQMVAKMPEGPMKEQGKQALAMMAQAVNGENANVADIAAGKMALFSMMGQGQNGQPNTAALRMMGQDKMADDIESKTVPGIPGISGRATIPVPQSTKEKLSAQHQYDEKAREYVEFAKKHASNWANMNPAERARIQNQGGAMAANLQSLYRNKIQGGVYKKGEQEFIEQIIPDQPAKWSASFNAIPKVMQTIHDNQNDIKNTAGSVGLQYNPPPSAGGGSDPHAQAVAWAKANMGDPRAVKILKLNGIR